MKYKNIIFDGSNAIHRISSASPPLNNAKGERTEVIYGLLRLVSHVSRLNPSSYCYIALDGKGSRRIRQSIDPAYKDRRGSKFTAEDDARISNMHAQVEVFWEMFGQYLPIRWMTSSVYEADDIMAMVANSEARLKESSLIVSGDGDMLQLVSEYVSVYSPNRNDHCTPKNFEVWTKGFPTPEAFLFGKVLQGEPPTGDNIPGIRGLGPVSALDILSTHHWSLPEVMISPSEKLSKSKLGQAILCDEGRARIKKNYKLMSLRGHSTIKFSKISIQYGHLNRNLLKLNMAKMQFASLLAGFNQFINPFMVLEQER